MLNAYVKQNIWGDYISHSRLYRNRWFRHVPFTIGNTGECWWCVLVTFFAVFQRLHVPFTCLQNMSQISWATFYNYSVVYKMLLVTAMLCDSYVLFKTHVCPIRTFKIVNNYGNMTHSCVCVPRMVVYPLYTFTVFRWWYVHKVWIVMWPFLTSCVLEWWRVLFHTPSLVFRHACSKNLP